MEIVSSPELRVAAIPWRPTATTWSLTALCKTTFSLTPGEAQLALEQEALYEQDRYWDNNPARSVYAPGDFVPWKKLAEVMLVGLAFAAKRIPTRSLIARLIVGDVDKSIEVFCDRVFTDDGALQEG